MNFHGYDPFSYLKGGWANGKEEYLIFYRFSERHWRHIRTSNIIERAFNEVKRKTRVVGRFSNETSSLVMVFSFLEEEKVKRIDLDGKRV